jgi:hypothetical protein
VTRLCHCHACGACRVWDRHERTAEYRRHWRALIADIEAERYGTVEQLMAEYHSAAVVETPDAVPRKPPASWFRGIDTRRRA